MTSGVAVNAESAKAVTAFEAKELNRMLKLIYIQHPT